MPRKAFSQLIFPYAPLLDSFVAHPYRSRRQEGGRGAGARSKTPSCGPTERCATVRPWAGVFCFVFVCEVYHSTDEQIAFAFAMLSRIIFVCVSFQVQFSVLISLFDLFTIVSSLSSPFCALMLSLGTRRRRRLIIRQSRRAKHRIIISSILIVIVIVSIVSFVAIVVVVRIVQVRRVRALLSRAPRGRRRVPQLQLHYVCAALLLFLRCLLFLFRFLFCLLCFLLLVDLIRLRLCCRR